MELAKKILKIELIIITLFSLYILYTGLSQLIPNAVVQAQEVIER